MTDEQINAAIAEVCGWKCAGHPDQLKATDGWEFGYLFVIRPDGQLVTHDSIPNYCNDLNAMHEAEKVIAAKGVNAWWIYCGNITRSMPPVFGGETAVMATARQRAEAFLRTLGKWEVEK